MLSPSCHPDARYLAKILTPRNKTAVSLSLAKQFSFLQAAQPHSTLSAITTLINMFWGDRKRTLEHILNATATLCRNDWGNSAPQSHKTPPAIRALKKEYKKNIREESKHKLRCHICKPRNTTGRSLQCSAVLCKLLAEKTEVHNSVPGCRTEDHPWKNNSERQHMKAKCTEIFL